MVYFNSNKLLLTLPCFILDFDLVIFIMSSSKPTFVFVPGAWYGGSYFKPLKAVLSSPPYSYDFVSVSLPTILTPLSDSTWSTVQETFENDVNVIREKIDSVIDTGSNVVLVMHSWGGIPSTETMKYFKNGGYSDSKGREGKGKIVRMVWVASFPLLEGVSCAVAMGGKDLDWWDVNVSLRLSFGLIVVFLFYLMELLLCLKKVLRALILYVLKIVLFHKLKNYGILISQCMPTKISRITH